MKRILGLILFVILAACGQPEKLQSTLDQNDSIQGSNTLMYKGILKIYRPASGCMGSGGSHIELNSIQYQKGSQSTQAFNQLIDNLFNKKDLYNSYDQDGCFNFYKLNFNGEITQELIWTNGSEVMKKVIHVSDFKVE